MEKHEINAFFEKNEYQINDRFVALLMENDPNHEGFGTDTESTYRAGSGFLTPVLQTALMTDSPELMDFQASWSKDRMPHYGLGISQLKENLTIYKQIIDETFPDELQAKAKSIIDHLVEQLSE